MQYSAHKSENVQKNGEAGDSFSVIFLPGGETVIHGDVKTESRADFAISDIIADSAVPEVEDIMRRALEGMETSVLLPAKTDTGYSVAHLKTYRLFSATAVRIQLYENKKEYLAISGEADKRYGRVFGHIGRFISKLSNFSTGEYSAGILSMHRDRDDVRSAFDASAVFDAIAMMFSETGTLPFAVHFENRTSGEAVCFESPDVFAGTVIMMIVVSSLVSETQTSRVSLEISGSSVFVETESDTKSGSVCNYMSNDLGRLYDIYPSNNEELALLEYLIHTRERDVVIECSAEGILTMRAVFDTVTDPERLKFCDPLIGIESVINGYLGFWSDSCSSDPEQ